MFFIIAQIYNISSHSVEFLSSIVGTTVKTAAISRIVGSGGIGTRVGR